MCSSPLGLYCTFIFCGGKNWLHPFANELWWPQFQDSDNMRPLLSLGSLQGLHTGMGVGLPGEA